MLALLLTKPSIMLHIHDRMLDRACLLPHGAAPGLAGLGVRHLRVGAFSLSLARCPARGPLPPRRIPSLCWRTNRRRRLATACSASQVEQEQGQQTDGEPAVAVPQPQQEVLRPPVALNHVAILPMQPSLPAAVQQLYAAVQGITAQHGAYSSGLVRLEVPVPRGCAPLWWLRGQSSAEHTAGLLHPRIFFSPRRSTAADTEGSSAAGAASKGCGSTAGAGAAWLWQGQPGELLGERTMRDMQRFLSAACPRVRAFGGARFNAEQQPSQEWQEFGSYCFLIPRLEYLEASGCNLLACTVAWDAAHDPSAGPAGGPAAAIGFSSVEAAVMDAIAALEALRPPAPPGAAAFKLWRGAAMHTPDSEGWGRLMEDTHAELNAVAAAAAEARAVEHALADPEGFPEAEGHGEAWAARQDDVELAGDDINTCTPLLRVNPETAREEYMLNGQQGLDELLAALEGGFEAYSSPNQAEGLTKVVLARRTDVSIRGQLDPLALLEALQERDPRAYQVLLQLPSGATFLGSTPECLYTRTGRAVASEAVAGTRARGAGGDVEKDFWLAFDLLRSHKDHEEFTVVRDWVCQAMSGVCSQVQVDVAKSVLKQGAVQHLYGKLSAQLDPGRTDAELLQALHPTPAVCGRPREVALQLLASSEPFDRGYYAGPFGWVSQDAAEFVVAIRSALVHPPGLVGAESGSSQRQWADEQQQRLASHSEAGLGPGSAGASFAGSTGQRQLRPQPQARFAGTEWAAQTVSLYAGVGIVRGSDTHSEWSELDLKMRQFERLLQTVPPLTEAPNINLLWATLMVEELCRLGCNTFCVAPGSRSSPLTVAIAQHPRARVVLCIDERSLGFWALGFGRATGRPAVVVTSSGTAVANLLPAVVEASQSGVPMLILTADRPAELRDTGANQTIDQVKMFGSYTRWHTDLPAPTEAAPARSLLSALDNAARAAAAGPRPGPVHLNCQFREPLAPLKVAWSQACLQGLERWELSSQPYTTHSTVLPMHSAPLHAALPDPSAAAALSTLSGLSPEAAAALGAVAGARRGLLVVGELSHPEEVVAAVQLARLLGWPVAADILSGLRAGVQDPDPSLPVIHHMDHLLLGGRDEWRHLRPDVVLQLGGHLTSKRLCQFLEWCALPDAPHSSSSSSGGAEGVGREPPCTWLFVDRHSQRHDQSWLLTHRVEAPLPLFAAAAAAALSHPSALPGPNGSSTSSSGGSSSMRARASQGVYTALLRALDGEVARAVDEALEEMGALSEPHIARLLAQELPPGEGLFVGNSMPIRDLDMYAMPAPSAAAPSTRPQGILCSGVGAPVAANRGASGIDGVLSTAAGFADGLGRGTTLVVGDLSFLHDINGLNLLRSGEMRPPLTVVLVNNDGGGIFSFLPIADAIPEDVFTPLWATPQHVDLAGMCRAQGLPHLKVHSEGELRTALRSAWALNRHSVVEVVTDRASNVGRHRQIQAAAQAAMARTLPLLQRWQRAWGQGAAGTGAVSDATAAAGAGAAVVPAPFTLSIENASYQPFSLPLARPLTTAAGAASHREGFLLRLCVAAPGNAAAATSPGQPNSSSSSSSSNGCGVLHENGTGNQQHANGAVSGEAPGALVWGVGEVAPLPGLSAESAQQAEQQLVMLCELLRGTEVPLTLALLGGRFSEWLERGLGVGAAALLPSVRAGLEAAVLSALAQSLQMPLADVLTSTCCASSAPSASVPWVAVNGLLDGHGSPQQAASAAAELVAQGYTALKMKVGRRGSPLQDAAAVLAVRQAVGPGMVLRADANRCWTLEQAVEFGRAAQPAGLQYIEEPVQSVHDVAEFHRRTGLAVALDETVDGGLVGPGIDNGQDWESAGVVGLVVKPTIVGGIERTLQLAEWACQCGMHAVVSSAFESPLGIGQWAELAAAVDAMRQAQLAEPAASTTHHGLATLGWFAQPEQGSPSHPSQHQLAVQPLPASSSSSSSSAGEHSGMGICLSAAQRVARGLAESALPQQQQALQGGTTAAPSSLTAGARLDRSWCAVSAGGASYTFSLLHTQSAAGWIAVRASRGAVAPLANGPSHSHRARSEPLPAPPADVHHSSPQGGAEDGDGQGEAATTVLFLHGFLGSAEDWAPLMGALSAGGVARRCIALDLPGHGRTLVDGGGATAAGLVNEAYSLDACAAAVAAAVQQLQLGRCVVVGYSLGARLALLLAVRWPHLFAKAVVVSGTAGMSGEQQRAERAARDDSLALALRQAGISAFLESWYQQPLWDSLRCHPRFQRMLNGRQGGDACQLSTVLASMSPGRAPSLWRELRELSVQAAVSSTSTTSSGGGGSVLPAEPSIIAAPPAHEALLPELLLVVGDLDAKFVQLGKQMCEALNGSSGASGAGSLDSGGKPSSPGACRATLRVVPSCGHAVHVERPVELLTILNEFI